MSVGGKWRIIATPDLPPVYPDMVKPRYMLFEHKGAGEFAFGCRTGHIWQSSSTDATSNDFSWAGSEEMDDVSGTGRGTPARRHPQRAKSATAKATGSP